MTVDTIVAPVSRASSTVNGRIAATAITPPNRKRAANMTASASGPPDAERHLHAQDGQQIYQAAGNQYIFDQPPPAAPIVTNTLPRGTATFVGRINEIRTLVSSVTRAAETGDGIPIHAVDGMPGVGKTALAIHVGHQLKDQFPDGQLFLDLHAHSANQTPVDPADALYALLSVDGVPPAQIPDSLDARSALWRSRMAVRRVLVIMDNAAERGQVEPLLPGSARCLVLITSRRRLTGLRVRHAALALPLDTLPPEDAGALFARLAGRTPAGDEARAAEELVRLCGFLPLAISLLAAKLRPEPLWTVTNLVSDLVATQNRLAEMHAEDIAVAAAFDLSCGKLPNTRRRFFRDLGLHPGGDVDAYAAAALCGITLAEARRHLDALYDDHLLDQPEHGRYRMHDLIRDYTRTLAARQPVAQRDRAVHRVMDYYEYVASVADRSIAVRPHLPSAGAPAAVPQVSGPENAMNWMREEIGNLLACAGYAGLRGDRARLVGLTAALAAYLGLAGPWHQAIALHRAAASVAERPADRANALLHLGVILRRTGDYPGAGRALDEALAAYRRLGARLHEADVRSELGALGCLTSQLAQAEENLQAALQIYRDVGDRAGAGPALNSLSAVCWLTEDYARATAALGEALAIYEQSGDRLGQANTLLGLGVVRQMTNDYQGAIRTLEDALTRYRDVGYRLGQANARLYLGMVRWQTEDYEGAGEALRDALGVYREIGDRLGEANSLKHLGIVRRMTEDYAGSVEALREAYTVYGDLDDRLGQAGALENLGVVKRLIGDFPEAARDLRQALVIYRRLGSRLGQAEVTNHRAALYLQWGDSGQARSQYEEARRLALAAHSPLEEAHSLEGLARCALRQDDPRSASMFLREALEIYRRIEAPEATRTAAQLDALGPHDR
jgi:tetratricopeptide (TPR) repeat protein